MLKNIMNKINKMNQKKKKGFTLIELIIVIAIIAILAAIALPKFMDVRENSNVKSDISNAKNIQLVVASLIADDKLGTTSGFLVSANTATVDKLQTVPKVKAKAGKDSDFYVEILSNGEVKVRVGTSTGDIVYPDPVSSSPYSGK
jgi:type IV pilus assembly protein PilA